jgi:hypothetical protein
MIYHRRNDCKPHAIANHARMADQAVDVTHMGADALYGGRAYKCALIQFGANTNGMAPTRCTARLVLR